MDNRRSKCKEATGGTKMIEICPKCGNHEWDKEIIGDKICCPKCGEKWNFILMPLFVLTGCSGLCYRMGEEECIG